MLFRAVLLRAAALRAPPFFAALFRALVPRFALLFDAERLEPERFIAPPRLRLLELFLADVFLAPDFFAADFFVAAMIVPPELELSTRRVPRWTSGWDGRARSGARPKPDGLVEATSRDLLEAGDAVDPFFAVERLRAIVPARHASGKTHSHIDDLLPKLFPAVAASAPEDARPAAGRRAVTTLEFGTAAGPGVPTQTVSPQLAKARPRTLTAPCRAPPERARRVGRSSSFADSYGRARARSRFVVRWRALVASSVAEGSPLGDAADRAGGVAGGRGAGV